MPLAQVGFMPKILENLEEHRKEADFFDDYVYMMRSRKGSYCVDTRHFRKGSSEIDTFGGVLPKIERRRILNKNDIKQFTVCYHTGCGYFWTAMDLHIAGMELKRIFDKGTLEGKGDQVEKARELLKEGYKSITLETGLTFAWDLFMKYMEEISGSKTPISRETMSFLRSFFIDETSDYRDILRYMDECGVVIWNKRQGTFVMTPALKLDKMLPADHPLKFDRVAGLSPSDPEYAATNARWRLWVLCAALMDDQRRWEQSAADENKLHIKFDFHIQDLANGCIMKTDGRRLWNSFTKKVIDRLW